MSRMINYEHDYYYSGVTNMIHDTIPPELGHSDANDEWNDPIAAEANFINIDSYAQFASPMCTFIVGRIGSGKTAMLNKLKYSIDHGENTDFSYTIMLDTRKYIAQLGVALRLSDTIKLNYTEIEHLAYQEWEKTINILIMKTLYDKLHTKHPTQAEKIESYLKEQNLINKSFSVSDLFTILTNSLAKVGTPLAEGAITLVGHIEKYTTISYAEAMIEVSDLLEKHGKFLVLIDSIEKYEFNDTITLAILNALVTFCIEHGRVSSKIAFKMAAPSELIPRLLSTNLEKITSKIVYIRWSHDDLKKLVAVRLFRKLHDIDKGVRINDKDALDFFDSYYAEECITRCGFAFPTFSYCVAHTLKEPRQILSIFNAWLYYERKYSKARMSLIEMALDYDASTRVSGALSIYSSVHPQIVEMFTRTFANRKYCFSESEFDSWVAGCSNLRGSLDAYDIKKYFVSSGLVGTMIELHHIQPGEGRLSVDRPIRIKEVIFEYQIKERLSFNSGTKFCLHPMVYKALNIEVDRNTFVYPKPIELGNEFVPW